MSILGHNDVFRAGNLNIGSHFKRGEFACKCGCGFDTVDINLVQVLDFLRSTVHAPIIINSGCRCSAYNARIGGSKNSQHTFGRAADISCRDVFWETLKIKVDELMDGWGGVGYYQSQNFIHIDTRSVGMARWNG